MKSEFKIGREVKKLGTLTEEDLVFLIDQSHPGFECSESDIAQWIRSNEDIRILNMMSKEALSQNNP